MFFLCKLVIVVGIISCSRQWYECAAGLILQIHRHAETLVKRLKVVMSWCPQVTEGAGVMVCWTDVVLSGVFFLLSSGVLD